MKNIHSTIIISFVLLCSCQQKITSNQTQNNVSIDIAIINVNIIPMDTETILQNQSILIGAKKIISFGNTEKIEIPESVKIIDAKGAYLMPGLAEMHAHIPTPNNGGEERVKETLFLYLSNGITTIRGMLGAPYHLELKEKVKNEEVLSPRIYTSGPSLNGNSVTSVEEATSKVTAQQIAGYDFLKLHPGLTLEVFNAIVKTANEVGIKYSGHVSDDVGVNRAIETQYSSIDHLDGYLEAMVEDIDMSTKGFFGYNHTLLADESKLQALVNATKKANVWVVPTQSLMERFTSPIQPEEIAKADEMRHISPVTLRQWIGAKRNFIDNPAYDTTKSEQFVTIRRKLIKSMYDNGVGILLGSDAPQIFNVPGFSIHHELKTYTDAGLTPYQAIRTGTINPAKFFGDEGKYGVIKVGASADFLLLNSNPLEQIENLKDRFGVMVRGQWLSEELIQTKLAEISKKHSSK